MLDRLQCRLFGHRINRRRVRFEMPHFIANCERCGALLMRTPRGWIKADKNLIEDDGG